MRDLVATPPRNLGPAAKSAPKRPARPRARWVRSRNEFVVFLLPLVMCAASWAGGGVPYLTDAGFAVLTLLCGAALLRELADYRVRQSPARIVLHSGILVWFCQDYFSNWFDIEFLTSTSYSPQLIARVATMHALFVAGMVAGVGADWWKKLGERVRELPEPRTRSMYAGLVVALFILGLVPYVFFTRDSFFDTIYHSITGFYSRGARFTVARTGNLNYDWGGYLFELVKVGHFGGMFGAFYSIMLAKTSGHRLLGWGIWGFWTLMSFGSGTRGQLVAMTMPVIVLLFLRHHSAASQYAQRLRRRVPLTVGILSCLVFAMLQTQGQLRSSGLSAENVGTIEIDRFQGNHMFSEGLAGWSEIPDRRAPFFDEVPGAGAVIAIPYLIFRFAIHPIPRALWHDKPVDEAWAWHNEITVGTVGVSGTTVSTGLVGWWYFRFGAIGMLEGALVFGLLFGMTDRALQTALAAKQPFALVISLGVLAWLFRCFRDVAIAELWGVLVAAVFVGILMRVMGSRRR